MMDEGQSTPNSWTVTIQEGEDGDGIIVIPAHILCVLGWRTDSPVEIEALADGRFRISQKDGKGQC